MVLRVYRARLEKRNFRVWTYEKPDRKLEQYQIALQYFRTAHLGKIKKLLELEQVRKGGKRAQQATLKISPERAPADSDLNS